MKVCVNSKLRSSFAGAAADMPAACILQIMKRFE